MKKQPTLFISEEQIQKRVTELAKAITLDLKKENYARGIVFIGILKGSVIFFSDLVRQIDLPISFDFMGASSYGQRTTSSGTVKITLDLSLDITDKHVVVVEDVVDTGLTLDYMLEYLRLRKPATLRLCALLLKPANVQKKIPIDYLGFTVDNRFVVGYGLDANDHFRNLPYLAYLPETKK